MKPLCERFCAFCHNCQIGDDFHYILECDIGSQSYYTKYRKYFLCKYYCQRPTVIKFIEPQVMSTHYKTTP